MYTPLDQAIRRYEQHLNAADLADNTIKNKTQVLRLAQSLWGRVELGRITAGDIDRLFAHHQWAPNTRNLYLGYLRQFFDWARANRLVNRDFDPTLAWRTRSVPVVEKLRLEADQFYPLMDACEHPRDRAVIAVGLFAFLRGSELQTLQIQDVDMRANVLHVYRHKTREADELPICSELREELVAYLNWYRSNQGTLVSNWYLLPSKKPRLITWEGNRAVFVDEPAELRPTQKMTHPYRPAQRALAVLGYPTKREGEHTLRRSGARALFDVLREQGYDGALMRVASMLGHKDTKITAHYIGLDRERRQRNEALAGRPMLPNLNRTQGMRVVR